MTSLFRVPGVQLLVGDNIRWMRRLEQQGVRPDVIMGSPPYALDIAYDRHDDGRPYEVYLGTVRAFCRAAYDLGHPETRLLLNTPLDTNLGGKRAVYAHWLAQAEAAGWQYQTTVVWNEGNIKSRTAWGSWLSPSAPFVTAPVEMVVVLYKERFKRTDKKGQVIGRQDFLDWTLGLWSFPNTATVKRNGHPAAYDEELPRRLLTLYSFPGDLVLAPWNGSGTDTLAARALGRFSIGIDQSPLYAYRAYRRLLGDPQWMSSTGVQPFTAAA